SGGARGYWKRAKVFPLAGHKTSPGGVRKSQRPVHFTFDLSHIPYRADVERYAARTKPQIIAFEFYLRPGFQAGVYAEQLNLQIPFIFEQALAVLECR